MFSVYPVVLGVGMDLRRIVVDAYRDELESSIIYDKLSSRVSGGLAEKLSELAGVEKSHASFWKSVLEKLGIDPRGIKPRKTRVLFYLLFYRVFGLALTIKLLERGESNAIELYSILRDKHRELGVEESSIEEIIADEVFHEDLFVEEETRIRDILDHVRDIVLGMNDGLVEILSVSTGLAGAYGNPYTVALGGLIVGIAGSLSMGIGAYISAKSQKEVVLSKTRRFGVLAKLIPGFLKKIYAKRFSEKGFSSELAEKIASEVVDRGIQVESEDSIPSPGLTGLYTGFSYILGAVVPLMPYFLGLSISLALPLSLLLASLMLSITGSLIALLAGLSMGKKALELIASGLGAALITYLIGYAARTVLGIEVE